MKCNELIGFYYLQEKHGSLLFVIIGYIADGGGKNVLSSEVYLYRTSELFLNEGEVFSLHSKTTNYL